MKAFPETHRQGRMSLDNLEIIQGMDLTDCDLGVQVSTNGRVWVCINGIAFIRFTPEVKP